MSYRKKKVSSVNRTSWKERVEEPICSECGTNESIQWKPKSDEINKQLCIGCFESTERKDNQQTNAHKNILSEKPKTEQNGCVSSSVVNDVSDISSSIVNSSNGIQSCRTSTRNLRHHTTFNNTDRSSPLTFGSSKGTTIRFGKGTSRRSTTFKSIKKPSKAPTRKATTHTVNVCYHGTQCFRVGDIVSVQDDDDRLLYFAQIRGLLTDQYSRNYGALTWLLPQTNAPLDGSFDTETFVLGPNDETLYPIESFEYLCRPAINSSLTKKWMPNDVFRDSSHNIVFHENV